MSEPLTGTPLADGWNMPSELAPHAGCWMLWPVRADNWREQAGPAQRAFAAVASAIAGAEPVTVGAPAEQLERARELLPAQVRVLELASDDAWMRDVGPSFLTAPGQTALRGVDWHFNAWGGLYESFAQDEAVAARVLELEGAGRYRAPFVLEGGSIHVDGRGTVLTTEECLLNPNRNPQLGRGEIERLLCDYLGAEKVVWLGRGMAGDETDGHIDNIACFVAPGVVLLSWCEDRDDPQHEISNEALKRLLAARDASGAGIEVVLMPVPSSLAISPAEAAGVEAVPGTWPRRAGDRMAGSYVNFYPANGRIVFPLLDERTDERAAEVLGECFPDRELVGVPGREILLGGGNIHCITQQVPEAG